MKQLTLLLAILFVADSCHGQAQEFKQAGEFKIYSRGLMYSDTTMRQLEFIVDSLNIKFRACDLSKAYYSKYQSKAHFVELEKGKIKEAKMDMENNISFADFAQKYPNASIDKDLLVVKYKYKNYDDKDIIEFSSIIQEHEIDIEGQPEIYHKSVGGTWILDYWKGDKYSKESISAFYFITDFEKQLLPEMHARMVQYSDCMVDTTTQLFKPNADRTGLRFDTNRPDAVTKFITYVHRGTSMPEFDKNDESYWEKYRVWDSLRIPLIDSTLAKQEEFNTLLRKAVIEALEKGGSDDEFEQYVGRYHSTKTELELKRGRIVVGGCSMDDSPRIHAMNIAILSAETVNWETFLRAHLDIMNDRFERASDGSYAWAGRKTYIRELEELDVNITDLLLGISLRIENPGQNHYYGSIGRLGRALSETKKPGEVEAKMLDMIQDSRLDDYNRVLICYLFLNYNYFIEDESRKKQNLRSLEIAVQQLPDYLATRIKEEK